MRILSVLLGCSLIFGTLFANAVSIEFEDIEKVMVEENIIQDIDLEHSDEILNSPLATENINVNSDNNFSNITNVINLTRAVSTEIPYSQNITITNYIIGNITSLPNDFIQTDSVSTQGYTTYIATESNGVRYFGNFTGYDSSFKAFIDKGRPYSQYDLSDTVFGSKNSSECTVIENTVFKKDQIIKLESVAKACGRLDQIQTLWVYIYQNGTKISEYKQMCKPITSGSHHIDNVILYYQIPSNENYTIKVKGKSMGCPNGYANGISVFPQIYPYQQSYAITYRGNGNTGGSTASQTKIYDTAINLQHNRLHLYWLEY